MREKGLTLLEIITTIALVALLSLIAIPSYHHWFAKKQSESVISQLTNAIHYARLAAIQRNEPVILCGSANHRSCDDHWEAGQIVKTKQGEILQHFQGIPDGELYWRGSFGNHSQLTFLSTGFTNGQTGSFCYKAKDASCAVIVLATGRVRVGGLSESGACKN